MPCLVACPPVTQQMYETGICPAIHSTQMWSKCIYTLHSYVATAYLQPHIVQLCGMVYLQPHIAQLCGKGVFITTHYQLCGKGVFTTTHCQLCGQGIFSTTHCTAMWQWCIYNHTLHSYLARVYLQPHIASYDNVYLEPHIAHLCSNGVFTTTHCQLCGNGVFITTHCTAMWQQYIFIHSLHNTYVIRVYLQPHIAQLCGKGIPIAHLCDKNVCSTIHCTPMWHKGTSNHP